MKQIKNLPVEKYFVIDDRNFSCTPQTIFHTYALWFALRVSMKKKMQETQNIQWI